MVSEGVDPPSPSAHRRAAYIVASRTSKPRLKIIHTQIFQTLHQNPTAQNHHSSAGVTVHHRSHYSRVILFTAGDHYSQPKLLFTRVLFTAGVMFTAGKSAAVASDPPVTSRRLPPFGAPSRIIKYRPSLGCYWRPPLYMPH